MAIRIIGPGAGINGASIADTNTGNTNTIGTGGMMMTNRTSFIDANVSA